MQKRMAIWQLFFYQTFDPGQHFTLDGPLLRLASPAVRILPPLAQRK